MPSIHLSKACFITVAVMLSVGHVNAQLVPLQNATATFSQTMAPGFPVGEAIDADLTDLNGWAIARSPSLNTAFAETAVFETVTDLGSSAGTNFTFSLQHLHSNPGHNMGKFRFSVTTDARSEFADGLDSGGDVSANWIPLHPLTASATGGLTLTVQSDESILASGPNPATSIYTVTALTSLIGITGIRLEALEDPSLPQDGPGLRPDNGNFLLTEFLVNAQTIPEPGSWLMIAAGFGFLLMFGRGISSLTSKAG